MTMSGAPTMSDVPVSYRITARRAETHDTVSLTLEPVGAPIPDVRPGQFTMMYAFGIGEIPVSVSDVAPAPQLTQTIRAVGAVTTALCASQPGQILGLRGPFGTGWNEAAATGGDLLIVAGGIGLAPLRPAVLAALAERQRFRRVIVLIGARSPAELIFSAELPAWQNRGAEVDVTVDKADATWPGNVGVVTQLLGRASLDPANTTALICGPEVMMRLTARSLRTAAIPATRIRLSLERNMQCGVAECGHCQLGPLLLCRDGPVVSYSAAEPLMTVREL
jgi:anaerobic sulfite reductase subunit B